MLINAKIEREHLVERIIISVFIHILISVLKNSVYSSNAFYSSETFFSDKNNEARK